MSETAKDRIEFGDYQTPQQLALAVCERLWALGLRPVVIIEPTCGLGAFVIAAAQTFPETSQIIGYDVNSAYLNALRTRIEGQSISNKVRLEEVNFFTENWNAKLKQFSGSILVLGNFPWVTNAAQSVIGGSNLPFKSNFLNRRGYDAISGKSNFDVSEWMLLEVLNWFRDRPGDVAMLAKTAVARKVLAHAERRSAAVKDAFMIEIDAKKEFGASVEACLLVLRLSGYAEDQELNYDYTVYKSLDDMHGTRVGHRMSLTVCDLSTFDTYSFLVGESPKAWRSGIKHDASAVMEFKRVDRFFVNGLGESVELEPEFLFPLLKGSDVGSDRPWRGRYVLVTQRAVGQQTNQISVRAPMTWAYLEKHASALDNRRSVIYKKSPRFSIFGVGDYTFRPWRIAICGMYKSVRFRLVGPVEGRPVMFDDTVYYVSFDTEGEAIEVMSKLNSNPVLSLLSSLIFWDEKRPIKTGILNVVDWSRLNSAGPRQASLI